MPRRIWAVLRCPTCRTPVAERGPVLRCENGHSIGFRDSYLDCLDRVDDPLVQETLDAFGYEWTSFDEGRAEDDEFWRTYFADVPWSELKDALVLDAGCGKGRFARRTATLVAELVALDGSLAVSAAAQNLAELTNVLVVRANLLDPPLADASFDFVYCLGVLHHLPDPRRGLEVLVRLLRSRGHLLLYVYSRPVALSVRSIALDAARLLRRLSTRLPRRLLRFVCLPLATLLYLFVVLPGVVGQRLGLRWLEELPLHTYRHHSVYSLWLDTFDRLSAPIERRYTWPELSSWFEAVPMTVEAVRESAGWFVLLRKE